MIKMESVKFDFWRGALEVNRGSENSAPLVWGLVKTQSLPAPGVNPAPTYTIVDQTTPSRINPWGSDDAQQVYAFHLIS